MKKLLECVPNFSEGNDLNKIKQITNKIESTEGVKLLDVDPGKDTNRTVVTFVGTPEAVVEAAFLAVKKASEVIDMSQHKGKHPRFGATDVCPLVPVSGITMDEAVEYARKLGERIGNELNVPVYCYEYAAYKEERQNLANCRKGEYEGLPEKLSDPAWKPDFGPPAFNARSGAMAVGARDFLVAYNINLNTTSTRRANAIAFDIRERGRPKRKGHPLTGEILRDADGKPIMIPGSLKYVKAIGWFIEDYGIAQISINLTNITKTPVHVAFDETCKKAEARGIRVTGSELVGLIPLQAMLDAGKYFLKKQQRSCGVSDQELIKIAVKSLGLDDLYPFKPKEKIIEYAIAEKDKQRLIGLSVENFTFETASESPAPGGGSVSAMMGAAGTALGTMVANLSSHKRGWDEQWEEFSEWAEEGKEIQEKLLQLIDEDTNAFNAIIKAFKMPKKTKEEALERDKAIGDATKYAIEVPFTVMKTAYKAFKLLTSMVEKGNPPSITDAGVGALAVRSCILGAFLNVKVNAKDFDDKEYVEKVLKEGQKIADDAMLMESEIIDLINQHVS